VFVSEALRFSWEALRANRVRSLLTALGMIIGTASVILVVTIALTGRDYIMGQIEGVGSNLIYAYYEAGNKPISRQALSDHLTTDDTDALRREVAHITAASSIIIQYDRLVVLASERDVSVIGTNEDYRLIRNLKLAVGRFFDADDLAARNKVCLLTEPLAKGLYGSLEDSLGRRLKIHGLQFTVIGTFREGVETFGQSEIAKETVLIPITIMRYFDPTGKVDQLYVSVDKAANVVPVTERVREVLQNRHRPGSVYRVQNLAEILQAASRIGTALTFVLILISAITLVISGIGIMNIMLVTVTERTREIGIKLAVGAKRREIMMQFLTEACVLSVAGGLMGTVAGVSIPLAVRAFAGEMYIPISGVSIAVALGVSCLVGVIFGIIPANRASQLNPTEALRYE
jgi:putative ABC transport system permease protein